MEILDYFNGSLVTALRQVYPQLKVKSRKRMFFEEFAQKKGFDPLVPKNWYSVTHNDILKEKVSAFV